MREIALIYGESAPKAWLVVQLTGLAISLGLDAKTRKEQLLDLATILADDYGWLKYTEFLQIFNYLRRYDFYGRFDPAVILKGIRDWNKYVRVPTIEAHERQLREAEEERWKQNAVPMPAATREKLNKLLGKFGQ